MFSMLLVYLFLTIPKLSVFFGVITVISSILLFGALLYRLLEFPTEAVKATASRIFKFLVPIALFCGFMTAVIPTKETSYAMAAAYVAQEAVQSELGQSAIALLQANVNEALAELNKPESKK